jgi:hypothetical protein
MQNMNLLHSILLQKLQKTTYYIKVHKSATWFTVHIEATNGKVHSALKLGKTRLSWTTPIYIWIYF